MNPSYYNISTTELLDRYLKSSCVIIDIRTPLEYSQYHIPNSLNYPYDFISKNPGIYLNKMNVYYIICNTGVNSSRLCSQLAKQNYSVVNVNGGIVAWAGPLEKNRN